MQLQLINRDVAHSKYVRLCLKIRKGIVASAKAGLLFQNLRNLIHFLATDIYTLDLPIPQVLNGVVG